MNTSTSTKILLATAFVMGTVAAFAQTGDTAGASPITSSTASQPSTAVGVTPPAAAKANRKAVPRSDTATVVRTGPTAGESAGNAADANSTSGTSTTTGTGSATGTSGTTGTNTATGGTNAQPTAVKARADRN